MGATGIVMVKATEMKSVNANLTKDELGDMHGTLVSENTIAIIHDHFLAFHMDLDVDGSNNSFVQGKLVRYSEPQRCHRGGAIGLWRSMLQRQRRRLASSLTCNIRQSFMW